MKKAAAGILIFVIVVTMGMPTKVANAAVTTAQTPQNRIEGTLQWAEEFGGYLSSPITVGDNIYTTESDGKRLLKINKSGKVVKEANLSDSLYWITNICYGDGKIFVPLSNGKVQAFDSDTLESVWISEEAKGPVASKLTYANGTLYAGSCTDYYDADKAGTYFAMTTVDEDSTTGTEEKRFSWRYVPEGTGETFYCNKGTIIKNQIVVAGGNGTLVSLDKNTGEVKDQKTLDAGVNGGNIVYDPANSNLYVTTKSSTLYQIHMNEEGKFEKVSNILIEDGGYVAGSMELYNGRLYVGGRQKPEDPDQSFYAKGFMAVIDTKSMKIQYKVETDAILQGEPLVKEDYGKILVYFTANTVPGSLYCLEDAVGAKTGKVKTIFSPTEQSQQNYGMSDIAVDKDGTLYYINDSKHLFSIATTHSYKTKVTSATTTKDGSVVSKCSECGKIASQTIIPRIAGIKLHKTAFTCNKKTQKPTVVVKDRTGKTISKSNYTISYSAGSKNPGRYYVSVRLKGNYTGSKTYAYTIKPSKTTVKLTKVKKTSMKTAWKKITGVSGYQIQYGTSKTFKKAKSVKVSAKTASKTLKKLKKNKKYYVRVRSYKKVKVNGKNQNLYASWSNAKKMKTKAK